MPETDKARAVREKAERVAQKANLLKWKTKTEMSSSRSNRRSKETSKDCWKIDGRKELITKNTRGA